jgi:hypothetical protein
MAGKGASLTPQEKRIVKALIAKGWKNQDINAWINFGRRTTVNFGRISGVKKDAKQEAATDDEVAFFQLHRQAYDSQTGLNRYDDERLIRGREAMVLAVQIFNSSALRFKTEVFCILANIAWTYLMHEYYTRKTKVEIVDADGFSLPLSKMIDRGDCPLSDGVKQNLRALKVLRDKVEHHLLGKADTKWLGLFQACCLNFDKVVCDLFGSRLTLAADLAFALQFARPNLEQAVMTNKYEVPPAIEAIDAQLTEGMTPEQLNDTEFQFQVVYTLTAVPKSKAHIQFVKPDSAEGKQIHNVLTKKVISDDEYPYKPGKVVKVVAGKTKKSFTSHTHQQAIRLYKVRPKAGAPQPENTDKSYCIYHSAHRDYTYSNEWVEKLVAAVNDGDELAKIKAVKL